MPEGFELPGSRFPDLGVLARAAEAGVEGHWDSGFLQSGDTIVAVHGWKSGGHTTNTVRMLYTQHVIDNAFKHLHKV